MSTLHDLAPLVLQALRMYLLPALFALLVIEEAGIPIPIPGDTLILLVGMQSSGWLIGSSLAVMGVSTLAVVGGSSVLFVVMRRGGRSLLYRYGKFLHLGPERIARMEGWFSHRERMAIIVGRFIPGMRIPTTALAGLGGTPYRVFVPTVTVAAALWSLSFFWLGVLVAWQGSRVLPLLDTARTIVPAWLLVLGALVVAGGVGFWLWRRAHRPLSQLQTPMAKD